MEGRGGGEASGEHRVGFAYITALQLPIATDLLRLQLDLLVVLLLLEPLRVGLVCPVMTAAATAWALEQLLFEGVQLLLSRFDLTDDGWYQR